MTDHALPGTHWADLVRSVKRLRSKRAPFFKPALLIAVLDLIDEGAVDPSDIDPMRVMDRFTSSIAHLRSPDPRNKLWRPLWHLSGDGAWGFSKAGSIVRPEAFGDRRKPDTANGFFSSFDAIAVPASMLPYWRSPEARAVLRAAIIGVLMDDDVQCRELAALLSAGAPMLSSADEAGRAVLGGQGFEPDAQVRRIIENDAISAASSWLVGEGWRVSDRSATHSYDLFCSRAREVAYVEVKGTRGDGGAILLTRNEVEFAAAHRDEMMLVVVAGIRLSRGGGASGGMIIVHNRWAPRPEGLRPLAFLCTLDEAARLVDGAWRDEPEPGPPTTGGS